MALNKNLSDNFFCDYFKWLFIKEKEKGKRNPDIISHTCVCVCVATSVMETQLILHSHRKNINAYKDWSFSSINKMELKVSILLDDYWLKIAQNNVS